MVTTAEFEPFPLVQWLARRSRRQVTIVATIAGLYVLWRVLRWFAAVQLDRWWLDVVTDAPVWSTRVGAQLLLAVVSGVVTLVVGLIALRAAYHTAPRPGQKTFRPIDFIAGRLGPVRGWATWLIPLYLAYRVVPAATGHWMEWALFRNGSSIGVDAPEVGFDVGYHLFTLPMLRTTFAWLSLILTVVFVVDWALLVLNGSLRLPIGGRKSSIRAVRILCSVGAAWLVVQALNLWLVRYPALASSRLGRFDGAGYAEMHSDALGFRPVAILCVVAAALLVGVAAGRVRVRWAGAAVGATALAYLIFAGALTPLMQRLVVNPSEAGREATYVNHNLDATKTAFGLNIAITGLELSPYPTASVDTSRVPIFEQTSLAAPFQVLQGTRATKVTDVDLDRYEIDGESRPVYVGARSASRSELPERGWVNERLIYTHGDGVVAALADATNEAGGLDFTGIEQQFGAADTDLYFGEGVDGWYVFTGTDRTEFDGATYRGEDGVDVGSRWRQLVAGLALSDRNTALSSEFTPDTQLLYRRSIAERINAVAPFLAVDGDPYPVITDGGVVWVVDTYVTSSSYPYAQQADLGGLPTSSGLRTRPDANYVRHAAIVTVDAATGDTHFYRTADDDPIVEAWAEVLPSLFEEMASLPPSIAAHRRYPTDGFTVQTNMVGRYHAATAEQLFTGDDAWLVSPALVTTADGPQTQPSNSVWQFVDSLDGAWATVRPLSPGQAGNPGSSRDELAALAVGRHDTGELTVFSLAPSTAAQLPSPQVAQSIIASDPEISQLLTLLNANGSTVQYGPNTPLVVHGTLSWYRTIVVQSTATVSTPRLHSKLLVSADGVQVGVP